MNANEDDEDAQPEDDKTLAHGRQHARDGRLPCRAGRHVSAWRAVVADRARLHIGESRKMYRLDTILQNHEET